MDSIDIVLSSAVNKSQQHQDILGPPRFKPGTAGGRARSLSLMLCCHLGCSDVFLNSLVLNELSHRDWPTSRLVSCFNFFKSSNSSKCFFFIGWSAWLNFHTEGISTKWLKRKMKTMAGPQWRDRFNESKDKGNWLFLSASKSWKKLKDYSCLISKGSTSFKRIFLSMTSS